MGSKSQAHTLAQVSICLAMCRLNAGHGRLLRDALRQQGHELRIEVKADKLLLLKVIPCLYQAMRC